MDGAPAEGLPISQGEPAAATAATPAAAPESLPASPAETPAPEPAVASAVQEAPAGEPEKAKSWREDRSETQQKYDAGIDGLVAIARKNQDILTGDESAKKTLTQTLEVCDRLDDQTAETISAAKYNPDKGDFIDAQNNPDNFQRHLRVIVDSIKTGIREGKLTGDDLQIAKALMQKLEPRLVETKVDVGGEKKDGYIIDMREAGDSVILVEQNCLPLLKRIKDAFEARKLNKNRNYQETYTQVVTEIFTLINQTSGGLDFDMKLQTVCELLNNPQVQEVLTMVPAVDTRFKDQQSGKVRGKVMPTQDLIAELRIKNGEVTQMGQKNLVANWLIGEMKAAGINVSEVDAGLIAQRSGLELLTKLERADFENWANAEGFINKIRGSIFGAAGRIDIDIAPLKELVKKREALGVITGKVIGGKEGLNAEMLAKYGFSEEEIRLLGRLKKKFPVEKYGMYFMLLYGMFGPSIFGGLGDDEAQAGAERVA